MYRRAGPIDTTSRGSHIARMTLYWLAGLLEAEGSFLAGPPSSPRCCAIRLPMTDEDVVGRVAALFDRAVVAHRVRDPRFKRPFSTTIRGASAARIMATLAPIMSARRRTQIERAMLTQSGRPRWRTHGARCTAAGCEASAAVRGLCRRHYRRWWKQTRRGRTTTDTSPAEPQLVTDAASLDWASADERSRIAWLAGLLEGEATISLRSGRYPRISITMCDRSVLERAVEVMPGSRLYAADRVRSRARG